jgi:hypothetical protein
MKKCTGRCDEWLPENRFGRNSSTSDGLQRRCKECLRDDVLERKYNKPAADLRELQDEGECGICGEFGPRVVDHDHATGVVRDGLCAGCNLGLGHFGDDPHRLLEAANYVEVHDTRQHYPYTMDDDPIEEWELLGPDDD